MTHMPFDQDDMREYSQGILTRCGLRVSGRSLVRQEPDCPACHSLWIAQVQRTGFEQLTLFRS